jgi:hypothetical protein
MMETKLEPRIKLNTEPNQCEYCDTTPNVLYVFGSSEANIEEFQLCLPCRNFIIMRMKVLIENKKAQMRENTRRKLTKGIKRSEETRRYPQGDIIE